MGFLLDENGADIDTQLSISSHLVPTFQKEYFKDKMAIMKQVTDWMEQNTGTKIRTKLLAYTHYPKRDTSIVYIFALPGAK